MSAPQLSWDSGQFALQHDLLDEHHRTFIELVNACNSASKADFPAAFEKFFEHTKQHFDDENRLMLESAYPSQAEHHAEHERVLGELTQFAKRIARGNAMMARAYIKEKLPEWFALHTSTMDSALAVHIAKTSE